MRQSRLRMQCLQILLIIFVSISSLTIHASENPISKKEAITKVSNAYPGKVLKTTSVKRQGTTHYRVRMLLPNGRVINVLVNANNGRMKKE